MTASRAGPVHDKGQDITRAQNSRVPQQGEIDTLVIRLPQHDSGLVPEFAEACPVPQGHRPVQRADMRHEKADQYQDTVAFVLHLIRDSLVLVSNGNTVFRCLSRFAVTICAPAHRP